MDRPTALWKELPLETRVAAAEAFWRDQDSPEVQAQQAEAVVALARRLNFRVKSIRALPVERRARHLAQLPDISEAVATRALVAYHFSAKRPLMSAFLDALKIPNEQGLITAENVAPPAEADVRDAVSAVQSTFDAAEVDLYLRTLLMLDGDTWAALRGVLEPRAAST
jgi:hypothetical protein